jgi:hypothetical protein
MESVTLTMPVSIGNLKLWQAKIRTAAADEGY